MIFLSFLHFGEAGAEGSYRPLTILTQGDGRPPHHHPLPALPLLHEQLCPRRVSGAADARRRRRHPGARQAVQVRQEGQAVRRRLWRLHGRLGGNQASGQGHNCTIRRSLAFS